MDAMDAKGDNTHFTKRVTLPSGKTIEVVYFNEDRPVVTTAAPRAPGAELHICQSCDSDLVYPVDWDEAGTSDWEVLLRCPNCWAEREGRFTQAEVEAYDEQLDDGADALARCYTRLLRANMAEEIDRFTAALHAGHVLPEDF